MFRVSTTHEMPIELKAAKSRQIFNTISWGGQKGEIEKKEDFLNFLGEYVVQEKYISDLKMDPDAYNPDSELTIDKIKRKYSKPRRV